MAACQGAVWKPFGSYALAIHTRSEQRPKHSFFSNQKKAGLQLGYVTSLQRTPHLRWLDYKSSLNLQRPAFELLRVAFNRPIRPRRCQRVRSSQDNPTHPASTSSKDDPTRLGPLDRGQDNPDKPGTIGTSQGTSEHHRRRFGKGLRRRLNKRAASILHTFRKEEKIKVEYASEDEELAALTQQRYKLASGLKRTLLRIGVCFVVLAVIKIINALREALLVVPVDYFKLAGVLGSLDYWALAFLVFDIRKTIIEIEQNDGDGDPTVRVLEQENVAIGISFEKFFKRMFKVLSAIAFAQVLGVLSLTGFQLAPAVDNGLRQLWGFVSPHL